MSQIFPMALYHCMAYNRSVWINDWNWKGKNTRANSQCILLHSNEDIITIFVIYEKAWDLETKPECRVNFLTALSDNASWLLPCAWEIGLPTTVLLQWFHLIVIQRSKVCNSLTKFQCLPNSIAVIRIEKGSVICVSWSNFIEKDTIYILFI